MFLSLAACDQRDAGLFKPLLAATAAVLPDIMSAAAAKPAPGAAPKQGRERGGTCSLCPGHWFACYTFKCPTGRELAITWNHLPN